MNKTSSIDWFYLRPTLIITMMAFTFSMALVYLSQSYLTDMRQQYNNTNSAYNNAKSQLHDVQDDELIIQQYRQRFETLQSTGIFDSKQRIDWVDSVNNARKKMKLPMVSYQISAQKTFNANYLSEDEHAKVKMSHINLEAGLLHEDDLADLFNWMARYAPGQLHLSRCDMKPVEGVYGYYAERPNLLASCELLWLTVHPSNGGNHGGQGA